MGYQTIFLPSKPLPGENRYWESYRHLKINFLNDDLVTKEREGEKQREKKGGYVGRMEGGRERRTKTDKARLEASGRLCLLHPLTLTKPLPGVCDVEN